eukprot:363500-Chlamydomonas_euryale.AAC.10
MSTVGSILPQQRVEQTCNGPEGLGCAAKPVPGGPPKVMRGCKRRHVPFPPVRHVFEGQPMRPSAVVRSMQSTVAMDSGRNFCDELRGHAMEYAVRRPMPASCWKWLNTLICLKEAR